MEEKLKSHFEEEEKQLDEIRAKKKKFQEIPGIGKSLAQDLIDLGYHETNDLQGEDPNEMYQKLCSLRGENIDRCVLYVFRCATYYVNNSIHEPELLKWWNWKD